MKSFLNNCCSSKPADPAEVKAILFAVGVCVLFIGFLTTVHRSEQRHIRTTVITNYEPPPPPRPVPPVSVTEPPVPDLNARFRVVPAEFRGINFLTHNYGPYEFSNGTTRDLVLIDGKARHYEDSQEQQFDLSDVLYTDLTGDGNPEAIVLLTHLGCGQKCDGGKSLLYVYSQEYPMQEILKYESGSGLDGCSLKSINVKNGRLTLDLFDRCPKPAGGSTEYVTSTEYVRRATYDVTRLEFFFNGKQLVQRKKTFLTLPDRNEVSYGVQVNIVDKRLPPPHEL